MGPGTVGSCWQRGISEGTGPLVSAWPQPVLCTHAVCGLGPAHPWVLYPLLTQLLRLSQVKK